MKVAILAGGRGSRLPGTPGKAKAMVEIGDLPILCHIMKYYGEYGFCDFVVALGYQGRSIIDYFAEIDVRRPSIVHGERIIVFPALQPDWTIELVDTGLETMSGGRIKRLAPYLGARPFMLTWCDGLADIRLDRLLEFHERNGRIGTLTAVHPPGRFGRLALSGDRVVSFQEKIEDSNEWINGAFFVFESAIFDYIDGDATEFERAPLERLASDGELMAYRHDAFWQCMDNGKEVQVLNALWDMGAAPWKVWS
jgi:glucose-1-phosphate cytidylyltransferase